MPIGITEEQEHLREAVRRFVEFRVVAVPGHTGLIVDYGNTAAGNPIEQGGFADIRAAYNRDDGAWSVARVEVFPVEEALPSLNYRPAL